jgi:hypothetical protein
MKEYQKIKPIFSPVLKNDIKEPIIFQDLYLDILDPKPVQTVCNISMAKSIFIVAKEEGIAHHIIAKPGEEYTTRSGGTHVLEKGKVQIALYNPGKDLTEFWEKVKAHEESLSLK